MEFLKSVAKSVTGSQEGPVTPPSVAETIEKLLDRVQTSTLLEDRRDACRALKSLSKTYRLEVGAQGLEILISVLEVDKSDIESLSYSLDSLCNIISGPNEDPFDSSPGVLNEDDDEDVGIQFTEIFSKKSSNVHLVLDALKESDFKVRWPALKLLMGLLRHKLRDIQECVQSYDGVDESSSSGDDGKSTKCIHVSGVSRIMNLLDPLKEDREIIRNDVILLMVLLTKNNQNIQRAIGFDQGFDRIFTIIQNEGYFDGGVVVEDCLIVLQNLLKNNTVNQSCFKESSYIQRLLPFLEFPPDTEWSTQKTSNILFLLQVIRALVSPSNPTQVTASSQKVMSSCGLFEKICSNLLMAPGIPSELLMETINTCGEIIRANHHNQEFFASINAPTSPPKPILVVLLMSMVSEKQSFDLRCSVLYCFQCFLFKNELGQAQIIQTLLPNSTEVASETNVTAGQLLCGGLFSGDTLTNWFVAVALSHTLVDNKMQKEQLLRVQLATDGNASQPVALMTQVCAMLHQGVKFQKRTGILMLLCTWLSYCPLAVSHFLNIPTNVPYLTSQVSLMEGDDQEILVQGLCAFLLGLCINFNDDSVQSFTRADLTQLITKRAGVETFLDKLGSISKSPSYATAAQRPQLKYRKSDDLVFDYEFCHLFKSLEHVIINSITVGETSGSNNTSGDPLETLSGEQLRLVTQYKEMIREQDIEIQNLRRDVTILREENSRYKSDLAEFTSTCQQLRDQNNLLKATYSMQQQPPYGNQYNQPYGTSPYDGGSYYAQAEEGNHDQENFDHSKIVDDLKSQNDHLNQQISQLTVDLEKWKLHASQASGQQNQQQQQQTSPSYATFVPDLSYGVVVPNNNDELISQYETEITQVRGENDFLRQQVSKLELDLSNLTESLDRQKELTKSRTDELKSVCKEQEDLLIVLNDQDVKISEYKRLLKSSGLLVDNNDDQDEQQPPVSPVMQNHHESPYHQNSSIPPEAPKVVQQIQQQQQQQQQYPPQDVPHQNNHHQYECPDNHSHHDHQHHDHPTPPQGPFVPFGPIPSAPVQMPMPPPQFCPSSGVDY